MSDFQMVEREERPVTADLVAFLRERLAEDEQVALEARERNTGHWFVGDKWNVYDERDEALYEGEEQNPLIAYGNAKPLSEHTARHDPARVLAEVAAKRRMIEEPWGGPDHHDMWEHHLRLLALPYAGHPDYREEWRP